MSAPTTNRSDARALAPDDPRHGTANGYRNLRCRCEPCRASWAAYTRDYSHRVGLHEPREVYLDRVELRAFLANYCGTETGYIKRGCRCAACRDAMAAARASRRGPEHVNKHGTHGGYSNGCRCDSCRLAQRAYETEYRARRRAERSPEGASTAAESESV